MASPVVAGAVALLGSVAFFLIKNACLNLFIFLVIKSEIKEKKIHLLEFELVLLNADIIPQILKITYVFRFFGD